MKITIDKIMLFGPCYAWSRKRMLSVTCGRESVDTSELAGLDIPTEDLIWLTDKILKSLGNRDDYMLAAAFAERVLPLYERQYPGDTRPRDAIRAARLYVFGEIKIAEINEAVSSAYDAAEAAYATYASAAYAAAAYATYASAAYAAASAASAASANASAAAYAASEDANAASSDASAAAELTAQRKICAVFLGNMEY